MYTATRFSFQNFRIKNYLSWIIHLYFLVYNYIYIFKQSVAKIFDLDVMTSCCFFVSLSSLCFATDEDGRAVENFCNTLLKCINYNLHEEMFCFNVYIYIYI